MAVLRKRQVVELLFPYTADQISRLSVGDVVFVSGPVFTGRDQVHKWLHDGHKPPAGFRNSIIYHCGPVVVKQKGKWLVKAAGPTTSMRLEQYTAEVIERFGIRAVIGKGGMGDLTLSACKTSGCVYLEAIGGAAQVAAEAISRVKTVHLLEKFGETEAMWELELKSFPTVVTMDSHGHSLHKSVEAASQKKLRQILNAM